MQVQKFSLCASLFHLEQRISSAPWNNHGMNSTSAGQHNIQLTIHDKNQGKMAIAIFIKHRDVKYKKSSPALKFRMYEYTFIRMGPNVTSPLNDKRDPYRYIITKNTKCPTPPPPPNTKCDFHSCTPNVTLTPKHQMYCKPYHYVKTKCNLPPKKTPQVNFFGDCKKFVKCWILKLLVWVIES